MRFLPPWRLPQPIVLTVPLLFMGLGPAGPAPALGEIRDHRAFRAAVSALNDGIPAVAAAKLARLFADGELDPESMAAARPLLVEAHVRAGAGEKALAVSGPGPDEPETADLIFWKAEAMAQVGQVAEAEALLVGVIGTPDISPTLAADARIARAGLLVHLGRSDEAMDALEPLIQKGASAGPTARAQLLAAEIDLAAGRSDTAVARLRSVPQNHPATASQVAYLAARAHLANGEPGQALAALRPLPPENAHLPKIALVRAASLADSGELEASCQTLRIFISSYPSSPLLPLAFAQLDRCGDFRSPASEPQLESWLASGTEPLATLAAYYQVLAMERGGDRSSALAALDRFIDGRAGHPLASRARLLMGAWLLEDGRGNEAHAYLEPLAAAQDVAPTIHAHVAFLTGQIAFDRGDFTSAKTAFASIVDHPRIPDRIRSSANFNAAVAALKSGEGDIYLALAGDLAAPPADEPPSTRIHLQLERGLDAAGNGNPEAAAMLEEFLASDPSPPDAFRAHLALAELALLAFPAKPKSAREHSAAAEAILRAATPSEPLPADAAEKLEYLAIWIAGADDDTATLVRLGERFLAARKGSPLRDRVHMKIGETYFRKADYPNARRQFELLDSETPDSPFAEPALFFAAKAALLTMTSDSLDDAIALWERVAQKEGALRLFAREQQALALHRLAREEEAVQLFDSILAADPPPPNPLRFSVTLARGESLFVLGAETPAHIAAAIAAFDKVAADPAASPEWRAQALFRKGKALEASGDETTALEAYYDVIAQVGQDRPPASAPAPAANQWFYRAGFEAMRLLETDENWRGAVRMAERLADAGGPRSDEAKEHAERLRLKHFIWE
ncbi:hypothetical protein BH23VER1_BH23VER1_12960 [soil metagenome]